MPFNVGEVPCTIVNDGGIVEGVDGFQGPTATVRLKCDWDKRYRLANKLLGESYLVGTSIYRTPPWPYPDSTNLYCIAIPEILGFPRKIIRRADGWVDYKKAFVTAIFGTLPYGFDSSHASGQPYTSISQSTSGEFITFPQSSYRFVDGSGTPTMQPIGRRVPIETIRVRRHRLPYAPQAESAAIVGTINENPYQIGRYTYPAGTLLYGGCDTTEDFDSLGNYNVEAEFKFSYRPINWNFYMHPDGISGYLLVTDDGTLGGNPPYEYGDFTILPG